MIRVLFISFLAFITTLFTVWVFRAPSYQDPFASPPTPSISLHKASWPKQRSQLKGFIFNRTDGLPLAGWVSAVGDIDFRAMATNKKGEFLLENVVEGTYQITAGAPGFRPATFSAETNAPKNLELALEPLPRYGKGPNANKANFLPPEQSLSGFVRTKSCGAGIFSVVLIPKGNDLPSGFFRAAVGTDGFFQFKNVPEGSYDLRVLAAEKATDLNFFFTKRDINVTNDPNQNVVEIQTECMEITGTILIPPDKEILPMLPNPLPHTNAAIRLASPMEMKRKNFFTTTLTDAGGNFRLSNLPVKKYTMEVLAPGFTTIKETITPQPRAIIKQKWLLQPVSQDTPTGQ